jgi:hypothetical protein
VLQCVYSRKQDWCTSVQKNLCQFVLYHVENCINLCQFGKGFLLVCPATPFSFPFCPCGLHPSSIGQLESHELGSLRGTRGYQVSNVAPLPSWWGSHTSSLHSPLPSLSLFLLAPATPLLFYIFSNFIFYNFGIVKKFGDGPSILGEWVYNTPIFWALPLHLEGWNLSFFMELRYFIFFQKMFLLML